MKLPELIPDNIYPEGPRLLLEVYKQADKTSQGLEISEGDGHATPTIGRVFRVGDPNSAYQVGDFLMWRRYGIDSIKVATAEGDVEFYLLEENEVIARVRGEVELREKQGVYDQISEKNNVTSKEAAQGSEEVQAGTGQEGSKKGR